MSTGNHPTIANSDPCLTLKATLVLISETVRFWSDSELGIGGVRLQPRCLEAARLAELRQSLVEIDQHCKRALALRNTTDPA